MTYLVVKSLHLVAWAMVIGGHIALMPLVALVKSRKVDVSVFQRVAKRVIIPGSMLALLTGIGLAYLNPAVVHQGWFEAKVVLFIVMAVSGRMSGVLLESVAKRHFKKPGLYHSVSWGMLAGAVGMIVLAVLKPF